MATFEIIFYCLHPVKTNFKLKYALKIGAFEHFYNTSFAIAKVPTNKYQLIIYIYKIINIYIDIYSNIIYKSERYHSATITSGQAPNGKKGTSHT